MKKLIISFSVLLTLCFCLGSGSIKDINNKMVFDENPPMESSLVGYDENPPMKHSFIVFDENPPMKHSYIAFDENPPMSIKL